MVNVFKVGLEGIGISCGWPGDKWLPIDLLYFVVMLPLLGITMVGLALPSLPQLQLHGVALDGCSSATFVRLVPCS